MDLLLDLAFLLQVFLEHFLNLVELFTELSLLFLHISQLFLTILPDMLIDSLSFDGLQFDYKGALIFFYSLHLVNDEQFPALLLLGQLLELNLLLLELLEVCPLCLLLPQLAGLEPGRSKPGLVLLLLLPLLPMCLGLGLGLADGVGTLLRLDLLLLLLLLWCELWP